MPLAGGILSPWLGQEALRAKRAQGEDPGKTPEALAKLAETQAARRAEPRAWDLAHPKKADPEVYWREVYPRVQKLQNQEIMERTRLSTGRAWRIRHGKTVPHRRWWEVLGS